MQVWEAAGNRGCEVEEKGGEWKEEPYPRGQELLPAGSCHQSTQHSGARHS